MPMLSPWPPTDPVIVLACTLWMEARSDGQEGMQAVANAVMNRVNHPLWWGKDIVSVCLAPKQFSSWNAGSTQIPLVRDAVVDKDQFYQDALTIAEWAAENALPDITRGADSYYSISMSPPFWARGNEFTVQIGRQRFYKTVSPPVVEA